MVNNITDVNLQQQIRDRAYVLDTPSLVVAHNEPVAEEVIRDLLQQNWELTGVQPKPHFLIPNDQPRNPHAAASRTQADTVSITNEGESAQYRASGRDVVDIMETINLHIVVPLRNGRQRMHNIKAGCRQVIYRYAKVLSPYHMLYYDGFTPTYEDVNMHVGDIVLRLERQRVPLFTQHTTGQETPASDPQLFPRGEQV